MDTWIYLVGLLSLLNGVRTQQCTESSLRSRYEQCLDTFVNSFYVPSTNNSQTACREAKTTAVDCMSSLVLDCGNEVQSLSKIIDVIVIEKAFQYACDSANDVSLGVRCYNNLNSSRNLQTCEETERQKIQERQNLLTTTSTEQSLCVSVEAHISCISSVMSSDCPAQSTSFSSFVSLFSSGCSSIEDPSAECGDDQVMTNFTKCVKPFFESIEKLNLDQKKCNESGLEVLKCVQKVVAKCAPTQRFLYIQKLLDLKRTKSALDYGCVHTWDLASGAFCYNKHYGSDIKPCLDKSGVLQRRASQQNQATFEDVCKYIDATTDCARDGMETCKDEAVTFSQYVRKFFPEDCTDDTSGSSHVASLIALTIVAVLQSLLTFIDLL